VSSRGSLPVARGLLILAFAVEFDLFSGHVALLVKPNPVLETVDGQVRLMEPVVSGLQGISGVGTHDLFISRGKDALVLDLLLDLSPFGSFPKREEDHLPEVDDRVFCH
jgi:hypothetical protein